MNTLNYVKILFLSILFTFISCEKDDTAPTKKLVLNPDYVAFIETSVGNQSGTQTINLTGTALTEAITLNITDSFLVSTNNINFGTTVNISATELNQGKSIYLRFSPTTEGQKTGTLTINSSEVTVNSVQLEGVALPLVPQLNINGALEEFSAMIGSSKVQSYQLMGVNLESDVAISVDAPFKISLDNATFQQQLNLSANDLNVTEQTLWVRFSPTAIESYSKNLQFSSSDFTTITKNVTGEGLAVSHNYVAFNQEWLAFGGGGNQAAEQTVTLHPNTNDIEQIKMFVDLDCPSAGCNAWDVYANIMVKEPNSGIWYEIGRYITPYGVDTDELERGMEIDVTDFKSLLTGSVELRAYIEVWGSDGWNLNVDFDFIEGTPQYTYSAIAPIIQYNGNSLQGVIYGEDASAFDLTKTISIPSGTEETHLRTIITGWGHATPNDADGRPCAEWCYRTHHIKINGVNTFVHSLDPIGCASNPVSPQLGNWQPDRAGWCPGMAVPIRTDSFGDAQAGSTLNYEYKFENWENNLQSTASNIHAYYAISSFVVVQSNSPITAPVITD